MLKRALDCAASKQHGGADNNATNTLAAWKFKSRNKKEVNFDWASAHLYRTRDGWTRRTNHSETCLQTNSYIVLNPKSEAGSKYGTELMGYPQWKRKILHATNGS